MKLMLVPADPSLAEWWFRARQDDETVRFNPLLASTLESLRERLSQSSSDLGDYETANSYFWALERDGQVVGHVTLQNINRLMLTAEIGYGVDAKARGQGVGTQGLRLVVENVFAMTPIRKLIAFVHEENVSSCRVLEKVGFLKEGLLRAHYLVNGVPANEAIYGLLRSDLETVFSK